MKSKLYLTRVWSFIVCILLLLTCFLHFEDFDGLKLVILLFVFIGLGFMQLKDRTKLIKDRKFSTMFIITNVLFVFIFLRDYLDPFLPIGSFNDYVSASDTVINHGNGAFISYNLNLFIITYVVIGAYNFINKVQKISK